MPLSSVRRVCSEMVKLSHYRCENCVEMLFVRGSGNCVQCDTPLRKSNFRVQLFEDPTVDKEVEIRKKVLKMWVRGELSSRGAAERLRGIQGLLPLLKPPLSSSLLCLFCRQWASPGGLKWVGSFPARFLLLSPSLPVSHLLFNSSLIDI